MSAAPVKSTAAAVSVSGSGSGGRGGDSKQWTPNQIALGCGGLAVGGAAGLTFMMRRISAVAERRAAELVAAKKAGNGSVGQRRAAGYSLATKAFTLGTGWTAVFGLALTAGAVGILQVSTPAQFATKMRGYLGVSTESDGSTKRLGIPSRKPAQTPEQAEYTKAVDAHVEKVWTELDADLKASLAKTGQKPTVSETLIAAANAIANTPPPPPPTPKPIATANASPAQQQ